MKRWNKIVKQWYYLDTKLIFSFQTLAENLPVTLLTSVSLISAFVIPLVGIIFGCFRCKGRCGGELLEEDLETNPKKQRQLFTAAIVVCSALIMWVSYNFGNDNFLQNKSIRISCLVTSFTRLDVQQIWEFLPIQDDSKLLSDRAAF